MLRELARLLGPGLCVLALLPLVQAAVAGTGATGSKDDDRAEIAEIVRDSIAWALTKDRARLESILAQDEDLFMFEPTWEPRIVGWAQFLPLFDIYMDDRFVATGCDVRDMRINLSRSGDVAWFSAILDDFGTWDGVEAAWRDTRWTGVLERRDGKWLIVQMHFSFASDKVAAEIEERRTAGPVDVTLRVAPAAADL